MFRNSTRYTASLTLGVSCMNCRYVKEHNWWPLIPFSARRLTEVSLNSCTVHSAQRYTWSSVHCMGRVWRGGRYIKTKGWPSLIPRLFPPPVFDCSSKNGGGRPGRFGHVWWCRQRVDKQGADRDHCTCVTRRLRVDQPQVYQTMSCIENVTVSSPWTRISKKGLEILCWALPLCVYLSLCHTTVHVTRSLRLSFPLFVYCKWSKTGWLQISGNKARDCQCVIGHVLRLSIHTSIEVAW